uniref:Uncharacterized protein n=1 Tax=Arundo donax TaxID=35708 RepID=A0A0A9GTG5_ARUDO
MNKQIQNSECLDPLKLQFWTSTAPERTLNYKEHITSQKLEVKSSTS